MDHHEYQKTLHLFESCLFNSSHNYEDKCLSCLKELLDCNFFNIEEYLNHVSIYNILMKSVDYQWSKVFEFLYEKGFLDNLSTEKLNSLFLRSLENHMGAKDRKYHGKNNQVFHFFLNNFKDKIVFNEEMANNIVFKCTYLEPKNHCLFDKFNLDYSQEFNDSYRKTLYKNKLEFSIKTNDIYLFKTILKYYKDKKEDLESALYLSIFLKQPKFEKILKEMLKYE